MVASFGLSTEEGANRCLFFRPKFKETFKAELEIAEAINE